MEPMAGWVPTTVRSGSRHARPVSPALQRGGGLATVSPRTLGTVVVGGPLETFTSPPSRRAPDAPLAGLVESTLPAGTVVGALVCVAVSPTACRAAWACA